MFRKTGTVLSLLLASCMSLLPAAPPDGATPSADCAALNEKLGKTSVATTAIGLTSFAIGVTAGVSGAVSGGTSPITAPAGAVATIGGLVSGLIGKKNRDHAKNYVNTCTVNTGGSALTPTMPTMPASVPTQ